MASISQDKYNALINAALYLRQNPQGFVDLILEATGVTVDPAPQPEPAAVTIKFDIDSDEISVEELGDVKVTVTNAPVGAEIKYESSDDAVLDVQSGDMTHVTFQGVSAGTATITASIGDVKATMEVNVIADI